MQHRFDDLTYDKGSVDPHVQEPKLETDGHHLFGRYEKLEKDISNIQLLGSDLNPSSFTDWSPTSVFAEIYTGQT